MSEIYAIYSRWANLAASAHKIYRFYLYIWPWG